MKIEPRRTLALADRIGRPVVVFDIEHSGGAAPRCGILEFGAIILRPDRRIERFSTLLNPGDVDFNPFATRVHGITRRAIAKAPAYHGQCSEFIDHHDDSLWVGFNSNASDIPKLKGEHARFGLPVPEFPHRLDVMRLARNVAGLRGGLLTMIEAAVPQAARRAHRAMDDAEMTLVLLEYVLPLTTDEDLKQFGLPLRLDGLSRARKSPSQSHT